MSNARVTNADILAAIVDLTAAIRETHTVAAAPAKPATPARTRKPRKAAKPAAPEWIVTHAQNKDARRQLAAAMRANGVEPTGAAWTKAKKAAGIK